MLSLYSHRYPQAVVYMLQSSEYEIEPFLKWYWRTDNFGHVMHRRTLHKTRRAKLLLLMQSAIQYALLVGGIVVTLLGVRNGSVLFISLGVTVGLTSPITAAHLLLVPLLVAKFLVVAPKNRKNISRSKAIFANHGGITIAVVGSYGKTTMKELLRTVLSEGLRVAATPANKNVAASHAHFARKLSGDEDVLIIEYGEGKPGDVARFAATTKPNKAIITGLAPAHLDKYKTLAAAAEDIFSVAKAVSATNVYVNTESENTRSYMQPGNYGYDKSGVLGWKVSGITTSVEGTQFEMRKGKRRLRLNTRLVGEHLIGSIALCVALAAELGLSDMQITAGVAKTEPFEHRMQPRPLAGGWVIDDTYNGNLEGVRAGLELLRTLSASRKIYVTPGLVEQGKEAENVHITIGKLIAKAGPDQVVLMQNSVTKWITQGLTEGKFQGKLIIEDDPLNFYTNLDQFIAAGDVVLMQNDWTDNYN